VRNAYAYANPNSHDYGNNNTNWNTDCDAEAAETYADAEASPHTGAPPDPVESGRRLVLKAITKLMPDEVKNRRRAGRLSNRRRHGYCPKVL
jgi:hypothetical protein